MYNREFFRSSNRLRPLLRRCVCFVILSNRQSSVQRWGESILPCHLRSPIRNSSIRTARKLPCHSILARVTAEKRPLLIGKMTCLASAEFENNRVNLSFFSQQFHCASLALRLLIALCTNLDGRTRRIPRVHCCAVLPSVELFLGET